MIRSPSSVEIDLSALVHNLNQVKKLIGPKTRVMGIVKSDAYGHGLLRISRVLEKNGVDCLGVAHLHEGLELREGGIRSPVVILCGVQTREELREVVDKELTPVVFDPAQVEMLAEECAGNGKRINIQLKVDTGMGRLGIPLEDVGPFLEKIVSCKGLYLEALVSHLSSADEPVKDFTEDQIKNFKKAIETGRALGLDLPLNNLANSAGVMAHRGSHFDMVRPGIMLYGGLPSPDFCSPLGLKPVMGFKSRVLQVRDLPHHAPVSYGRTYHTKGPQRIAVIRAGYGDGLSRFLSNRGKALIGGKRVPIVGRVCMNMLMADITEVKGIMAGHEVVFLGAQGGETIMGEDMARWAETISYEIFCSLGQRNIREYNP